jgi:hypothetical protein
VPGATASNLTEPEEDREGSRDAGLSFPDGKNPPMPELGMSEGVLAPLGWDPLLGLLLRLGSVLAGGGTRSARA